MSKRRIEIFCPKCQWKPSASDKWICSLSCGCAWNTFDTAGVCPRCGKGWETTQCLACSGVSPHSHWYHEYKSDSVKEKQRQSAHQR